MGSNYAIIDTYRAGLMPAGVYKIDGKPCEVRIVSETIDLGRWGHTWELPPDASEWPKDAPPIVGELTPAYPVVNWFYQHPGAWTTIDAMCEMFPGPYGGMGNRLNALHRRGFLERKDWTIAPLYELTAMDFTTRSPTWRAIAYALATLEEPATAAQIAQILGVEVLSLKTSMGGLVRRGILRKLPQPALYRTNVEWLEEYMAEWLAVPDVGARSGYRK